jgi:hypothetical protein
VLTAGRCWAIAPVLHRYRVPKAPRIITGTRQVEQRHLVRIQPNRKFVTIYLKLRRGGVSRGTTSRSYAEIPAPAVPISGTNRQPGVLPPGGLQEKMTVPAPIRNLPCCSGGNLVVDSRTTQTMPEWVQDPFNNQPHPRPLRFALLPLTLSRSALWPKEAVAAYIKRSISASNPSLLIQAGQKPVSEITRWSRWCLARSA